MMSTGGKQAAQACPLRAVPNVTVHYQDAVYQHHNSLPSFFRDQQSLAAFRQQLKTILFRTSFGEDANA